MLQDLIIWVSGQTGLTESMVAWIGSSLVIPFLGWLSIKLDWSEWEKACYVFFYGWAQKFNDLVVSVPYLGYAWEKWFEPYCIKQLAGAFRVIAQIPMAIAAGFNSRHESLVNK